MRSRNHYRQSKSPSTCLVLLLAMVTVFACYLIWVGGLGWMEEQIIDPADIETAEARQTATEAARPTAPAFVLGPTWTPVPPCQTFYIWSETGTMRECPDFQCARITTLRYEDQVCVYGRAKADDTYPEGSDWYIIDQNPDGAFRDLAYIHDSVLKPLNPTLTPSRTFTPLPTVTITPSRTPPPTLPSLTPTPTDPAKAPTATITPQPTPTTYRPGF